MSGKNNGRTNEVAKVTPTCLVCELAGDYAGRLGEVLEDPKWLTAVNKALVSQANKLRQQHMLGEKVTSGDALKLLKTLGGSAAKETHERAKNDPAVKKLVRQLTKAKDDLAKSPVGVFVDENKRLLIVLAAGIVVRGAYSMYTSRSGDTVAALSSKLAEAMIPSVQIGAFNFSLTEPTFQPSQQYVSVTLSSTLNWKSVKGKFEVTAENDEGTTALKKGSGALEVQLTPSLLMGLRGGYSPRDKKTELGIGITKDLKSNTLNVDLTYSDSTSKRLGGQREQKILLGVGVNFKMPWEK